MKYSCEFVPRSWRGVLDTTLCDKACQWLGTSRWFSPGTPVFYPNKTNHHDITEILTVALKHHKPKQPTDLFLWFRSLCYNIINIGVNNEWRTLLERLYPQSVESRPNFIMYLLVLFRFLHVTFQFWRRILFFLKVIYFGANLYLMKSEPWS
jgi:hypothetical protein